MDIERHIVSKIIQTGDLKPITDNHITASFFHDTKATKPVFLSIMRHRSEYGSVPSMEAIKADHPDYKFVDATDSYTYLVGELQRQHSLVILGDKLEKAVESWEKRDPKAGLAHISKALSEIGAEISSTRDSDLTLTGDSRLERYKSYKDFDGGLRGIPSGFASIDKATLGFQNGQLNVFTGPPKAGKAQPLTTPILTPFGWTKLGDLLIGDEVVGSDGKPTEVVAVHERGTLPVYRVSLDDGSSTLASGDHLWTVYPHGLSKRTISTTDLINKISTNKRFGYLPIVQPIEFNTDFNEVLDPYLLGVLLGDGGLSNRTPIITTADEEIVNWVKELLPAGMKAVSVGGYGYRLSKLGTPNSRISNPLTNALSTIGLMGKRSWEKRIPQSYKQGPLAVRKQLLAGLLDTDGGVEGNSVTFCSTSQQLAEDVVELVQSLGGCARVKSKVRSYRDKAGNIVNCRVAHIVTLRVPYGSPFRLTRKTEKYNVHAKSFRPPTRRIVSIEPEGSEPVRCITVNNSDGLYVTEQFIVTHNSTLLVLSAIAALNYGVRPLFIGFEMSNEEQEERIDSIMAGISHARLRSGTLTRDEWNKLERSVRNVANLPPMVLTSDISSTMNLSGVAAKIDAVQPGIVFVDGVYMMEDEQGYPNNSPQALTNLTRGFKRLAMVREIPVCISTQVLTNKMSKTKGITPDAIGYSSSFQQDADNIIGVMSTEDNSVQELSIVLSRNCPKITFQVLWDWETGQFQELEDNPFDPGSVDV